MINKKCIYLHSDNQDNRTIITKQKKNRLMRLYPIVLILLLITSNTAFAIEDIGKDSLKISQYLKPQSVTDSLINFGKIFLRTPYRYGSSGPNSFDCSGFTSHVYSNFGINLHRSSADQARQFPNTTRDNLQTGDLVFFEGRRRNGRVGHVGIVVEAKENGEFNFLHAATSSGVIISSSNEQYYRNRFVTANRVLHNDSLLAHAAKTGFNNPNIRTEFVSNKRSEIVKRTIPGTFHNVRSGENLSVIAKKYGVSVSELKRKNKLKNSNLSVNQRLRITDERVVTELVPVRNNPIAEVAATHESCENTGIENPALAIAEQQTNTTLAQNTTHKVKAGETLFTISKQYNTTVDALKAANNIGNNQLRAGQELKISNAMSTNSAVAENENSTINTSNEIGAVEINMAVLTHKVKRGETLSEIGRKYNISIAELKQINQLRGNNIAAGQELLVTAARATVETRVETKPQATHVAAANTTQTTAMQTTVSQATVKQNANTIVSHKVQKGETLASIAKKYNTTIAKIQAANNMQNSSIRAGQDLQIGSTNNSPIAASASTSEMASNAQTININTQKYKIERGETLLTIAQKHNMKLDDLRKLNQLSSDNIRAGQEILVPAQGQLAQANTGQDKKQIHTVAPGDSFYSISKKYGCSIDDLMKWNNKTNPRLNAGEKLVVFPNV